MIAARLLFGKLMRSKLFWYGLLIVGALWSLGAYRASLIQDGYDKRVAEEKDERLVEQAEYLKNYGLMAGAVKGAQDVYESQGNQITSLTERLRASDQRLQTQRADFERRLKTASAESLRKYAEATERNFDGCRGHVERFGLEAANCARSAEALKNNLDAITTK